MASTSTHYDVVISGGGPAGLLTAYALNRMGVSVCVVERLVKDKMPMYGRACSLFPRTLELLDSVGLLDEFLQTGLVAHNGTNFDKFGNRVSGRGWQNIFSQYRGTFFDFVLNIRLKYSEAIIQAAYQRDQGDMLIGWEVRDLKVSPNKAEEYRVTVEAVVVNSTETKELKWRVITCGVLHISKYLIGADGGNSLVRRLSGIPFHPETTTYRWVRIDGVVKTNLPDERIGVTGIESVSHGNVLWVPLDHGRTRIGFALNPELYKKYGDQITEEQAKYEAIQAVRPFELEFESVDWYTIYSIRQGVAEQYMIDDCVLLAGDACHTHSSGAAQGMNTGVHDAINLSWKLGGVLRGWYKPGLLHTYDSERRPVAESVIEQDKQYSKLISGDQDRKTSEGGDVNQLLANLMRGSAQFVLGLGIGYDENMINLNPNAGCLQAGTRPDDALIYPPGRTVPVRFQQVTPNKGGFWAIVFTGNPAITRSKLQALRRHLDSHGNFGQSHLPPGVVQCLTVINGCKPQGEEALGMPTFGPFYYDQHAIVQEKFGFTEGEGGIAVLRPDGYLGFATALTKGPEVDAYFHRFVVEPGQSTPIARL